MVIGELKDMLLSFLCSFFAFVCQLINFIKSIFYYILVSISPVKVDREFDCNGGGGDGGAEKDAGMHPAHRGGEGGRPRGREERAEHTDGQGVRDVDVEAVPEDRRAGEVFRTEDREEGIEGTRKAGRPERNYYT